jgi:hypothetical protein
MSISWYNEQKRILRIDLHGAVPTEDLNAILDELGRIVETANEPVYLLFDAGTLTLPPSIATSAFGNREGTRFMRHPNARLIATSTHSPVLQYLGKFFAGDRLIIARTFEEATEKLHTKMREIGAL